MNQVAAAEQVVVTGALLMEVLETGALSEVVVSHQEATDLEAKAASNAARRAIWLVSARREAAALVASSVAKKAI